MAPMANIGGGFFMLDPGVSIIFIPILRTKCSMHGNDGSCSYSKLHRNFLEGDFKVVINWINGKSNKWISNPLLQDIHQTIPNLEFFEAGHVYIEDNFVADWLAGRQSHLDWTCGALLPSDDHQT